MSDPVPARWEVAADLLAPLHIVPGMRVLVAGLGSGSLGGRLVRAGAAVTVLEPHEAPVRGEGASREGIEVRVGSLREADGAGLNSHGYDMVLVGTDAPLGLDAQRGPGGLDALVASAVRFLAPGGIVVLVATTPLGLARVASMWVWGGVTDAGLDRGAIAGALGRAGLTYHRWLSVFPDASAPAAIVADELWERRDDAAGLVLALIGDAFVGADEAPGTGAVRLTILERGGELGIVRELAEACLVVAARERTALDEHAVPGLAWVASCPRSAPGWRRMRALVAVPEGWQLLSLEPVDPVRSGPLTMSDVTATFGGGRGGEDVLARILLEHGPGSAELRSALGDWWAASQAVMASGPADLRAFDILPRHFVVDADGTWTYLDQGLTVRFPYPPAVLALRAVMWLLRDRALALGLPGVSGSVSVRDVAGRLLEALDIPLVDVLLQIWIELEADLELRTGASTRPRRAIKDAFEAFWATPVASFLRGPALVDRSRAALEQASMDGQRASARATEAERERDALAERLAAAQREIAVLQKSVKAAEGERSSAADHAQAVESDRAALAARVAAAERERDAMAARLAAAERDGAALALRLEAAEQEGARFAAARSRPSRGVLARMALERSPLRVRATVVRAEQVFAGRNPLFDAGWYLARYPDVRESRVDPHRHYRLYGIREGRDPSPWFDTDWYLERYPDVHAAHLDPLDHYLRHGAREGRDPGPAFDTSWYLESYPDVRTTGMNPLLHYTLYGAAEGRLPRPEAGPTR